MEKEIKFISTSAVAITIGTIIGLFLYYHIVEPRAPAPVKLHTPQYQYQYQQYYY